MIIAGDFTQTKTKWFAFRPGPTFVSNSLDSDQAAHLVNLLFSSCELAYEIFLGNQ